MVTISSRSQRSSPVITWYVWQKRKEAFKIINSSSKGVVRKKTLVYCYQKWRLSQSRSLLINWLICPELFQSKDSLGSTKEKQDHFTTRPLRAIQDGRRNKNNLQSSQHLRWLSKFRLKSLTSFFMMIISLSFYCHDRQRNDRIEREEKNSFRCVGRSLFMTQIGFSRPPPS